MTTTTTAAAAIDATEAPRPSLERNVIASATLAHAATHAIELVYAALLVRIGLEFDADLAVLGVVGTAGTITFGTFALPSGWLVDRLGPRTVMTTSMASAAVFAILVAASPNLLVLAITLSLLGAGIGLYHPAGTAMVATVAARRGVALGIHGVAGVIGIAFAPAAAIGIAIAYDWRAAYIVFGIAAALVALFIWRLAPGREEVAAAVAHRTQIAAAAPTHQQRTTPPAIRTWFTRPLILIYLSAIGTGFIYRGSLTFLALHLERELGIEMFGWNAEAIAGATASLALLAGIIGQTTGGWLSDRIPVERAILPYAVLTPLFLALMGISGGVILLIAAAGFAVCSWAQQPVMNGLITDYAPEGAVGRSFGISFTLVFGVGSIASTFTGIISERWDIGVTFLTLAVIGVVVALTLLALAQGAERRRAALTSE
jgi:MFS family permease